jgi:hypothetical protein
VREWGFLTNHARALLCIASDPGVRLRDIAASLEVTERAAFGIVRDLAESRYIVKERDGRRNQYRIDYQRTIREPTARERTVGEVLGLLADAQHGRSESRRPRRPSAKIASRAARRR